MGIRVRSSVIDNLVQQQDTNIIEPVIVKKPRKKREKKEKVEQVEVKPNTSEFLNAGLVAKEESLRKSIEKVRQEEEQLKLLKKAKKRPIDEEKKIAKTGNVNDFMALYNGYDMVDKLALKKALEKELALDSYQAYLKYTTPEYKSYKLSRYLCQLGDYIVQKVENGEKVRLLISMPPRHGKSYHLTENFIGYCLTKNPQWKGIIASSGASIAEGFADKNRQKIDTFGEELNGVQLSKSMNTKSEFDVTYLNESGKRVVGGKVISAGLDGQITSRGATIAIIDDPFKSKVDSMRKSVRDRVFDTFTSAIATRMEGFGNAIIVIMTRWHDDDLIGRLLKQKEVGWKYIKLACECEDEEDDRLKRKKGEFLCPELGYDKEWAEMKKIEVGTSDWNALYQQKPPIDNGEIFNREWFRFYKVLPEKFDEMWQSWDCNFKKSDTSDFVAGQIWGRVGANYYLVKRLKARLSFTQTQNEIVRWSVLYPKARRKFIEDRANGSAIIQTLKNQVSGIIALQNEGGKYAQAQAVQPLFEAGNVYIPHPDIDDSIEEYINEFTAFPNGTNDDEVDSTCQGLNYYNEKPKIRIDSKSLSLGKALKGLFN